VGSALSPLREDNVLIPGSGSSFHNMQAFRDGAASLAACDAFDDWLVRACSDTDSSGAAKALSHWDQAPQARYAHLREEHLLPLHVCFGTSQATGKPAEHVFNGGMMGYRMSAFLWR
jgi:aromatic ring-opening dioxygenase catalytic subunit (LigB family)